MTQTVIESAISVIMLVSVFLNLKFTKETKRLKIKDQYYRSLFEENSDAVLVFDLEGRFLHINQSFILLFLYLPGLWVRPIVDGLLNL